MYPAKSLIAWEYKWLNLLGKIKTQEIIHWISKGAASRKEFITAVLH